MRFCDVVRADLRANTGRRRLAGALPAFIFHPGFATIFLQRVAMALVGTPLDKLGALIWAWNTRRSGCHLHLESVIGPGLYLPHPVAVVIGQGVRIGSEVTIYQSVTVGRSRRDDYPMIGDGATLYPGAIVFGAIAIGTDARIGAGAVVFADVPAGATAAGNPARIVGTAATD
jgi:serine O-acetyltransferase